MEPKLIAQETIPGSDIPHEKTEEYHIETAEYELNRIDLSALASNSLSWRTKAIWRLAVVILLQGLSVAAFAMDGSIIGSMASLPAFREYFNVGTSGSGIAIIIAGMSIGNAVASIFQWTSDLIGRRGVTCLGNSIIVISCVIQAAAPNNICMILGRVIGGAGCSLSATVGPMYISEIAPASHRGLAVGLFCSCYSIGAIAIACVILGGSYMTGDWSWRMPMVVQIIPPLTVALLVYPLTPESPRYLVYKGQINNAKKVIALYHTSSEDIEDPIVTAEIDQIQRSIESVDSKPWDFSTLWKMKSARYRLLLIFLYAFIQQCNGTGMLGYYLPGILTLVGITNSQQQLAINLGMTVASYLSTLAGALIIDRVTRRFLLASTLLVFIFFLSLMSVTGGLFANGIAKDAMGILTIVAIYLFQISNGLLSSTLHNVYPTEVLHYSQRAKGMGLYSFFQNCLGFAMTYGVGELLAKIEWKTYFMFIAVDLVFLYLTWQFFPEFRFLSLEEIDYVFETPGVHPVKMSKRLQKAKLLKRREATG
ncbi:Lactose permease [Trichoderma lentiforme]|uniref:Lactose permease n=1 Tax=Trichoderma lentiforme TaxID=1567552 RepID=A0A9P4XMX6_9HYPO|nr:Lactose permease [Trichoderma lentiforme]